MGNAHAISDAEVRNPGVFKTPKNLTVLFGAFMAIGALTLAVGVTTDPTRMWVSFVQNHFFFMSLAIGGAFFAAIQWMTSAMWSAPVRRLGESFTAYLPYALVTFVVMYFGMHHLYIWTHADQVKGDIILEGKAGYLNISFFMIRNIVAFCLWILFSRKMIGNSLKQDVTKDAALTSRNRSLAPAFLALFAITFTMTSFDHLMSLDPHWFSTMFGVYCFAGLFYSTLALICLMAIRLRANGALAGIVNDNHLHDLGKFMFAFTIFWAYIGFSQFMLIWYANLPEETSYFMHRFQGGWLYVSIFLLVGKFAIPFFLLLPRDAKRCSRRLFGVGVFMLVAQWIDVMWMVQPEFFKDGPKLGLIEIGVTLGFVGLFGAVVSRFLARNTVVAIGDPRLVEAVFHHHQ